MSEHRYALAILAALAKQDRPALLAALHDAQRNADSDPRAKAALIAAVELAKQLKRERHG